MFMHHSHMIDAVIYVNYISHIMSFTRIIIEDESSFDWKFFFFLFSYKDLKIFIESF